MAKCTHALVRCMDFRLESAVENYMEEKGIVNDCDIISVAGVTKDLIEDPEGFVATQIDISKRLHEIDTLIIMHHMDCGGYGGHAAFAGIEVEHAFQIEQMEKSKEILEEKYDELKVIMALAEIDENNIVTIAEIE